MFWAKWKEETQPSTNMQKTSVFWNRTFAQMQLSPIRKGQRTSLTAHSAWGVEHEFCMMLVCSSCTNKWGKVKIVYHVSLLKKHIFMMLVCWSCTNKRSKVKIVYHLSLLEKYMFMMLVWLGNVEVEHEFCMMLLHSRKIPATCFGQPPYHI